ncbi:MAG: DsbA family protein [Minisyncoccia bacterium]
MNERIPLILPIAIVLAGIIIGIAVFMVRMNEVLPGPTGDVSLLRAVRPEDHTIGNPEAPVTLVVYSDIECEYCKEYQEALEQVMTDYGPGGEVLLVYRHFPIIEAHPDAALHAEAAECAGKEGGDDAFFRFIDAVQQASPGPQSFDPARYGTVAESLGLSRSSFQSCIAGSEFETKVAADFDNGVLIGVRGTPHTLVLIKGGTTIPISGAIPYLALVEVVKEALAQVKETPRE